MSGTLPALADPVEMPDLIQLAEVAALLGVKLRKSEQSAGRWLIDALQDQHRGVELFELWGGQGHRLGDADEPGDGCVHPSPRRQWLQGRTLNAIPSIQLLQEGCTLAHLAVGVQVAMRRSDARLAFQLGGEPAASTEAPADATPPQQDRSEMTRQGLIEAYGARWPTIEADIDDAAKNGLASARAKRGWYYVEDALAWARQRGKLKAEVGRQIHRMGR
jgi:hypothetical protein